MKKGVMFALLIFLFLFVSPLASAELNTSDINEGLACVSSKTTDCTLLSPVEKIFASLATGQCISSVESGLGSNGCFPSGSCNIKSTSQAVLSLKTSGRSTAKPVEWLLSQPQLKPTTNINWYIQIDSTAATSCTISYASGSSAPVNYPAITVYEDKTLSNGAGTCLSVSTSGYWLLIDRSCYGTDFSIVCDQPFTTTELYQRAGYSTIYVSSSSNSASSGGTVHNSVNSSCFGAGTSCDYEASLWAALALDFVGKDISLFIPYLTVMADDAQNQQYSPHAFLYSLTSSSDFLEKLLSGQKTVNSQSYWDQGSISGPYFDTALALLPLQAQTPAEKASALNWLASNQGSDGCWNSGNLADTAFILYSVAGSRATPSTPTSSCSSSGFYCLSSSSSCNQSGGSILQAYTCSGTYVCCSSPLVLPTCSSQGGIPCASGQICQGGSPVSAADTTSGQICCLGGTCTTPQQTTTSACELAGLTCKNSCLSNEKVTNQNCNSGSQVCCEVKQGGTGIIWIILLSVFIVLALLGIIFRKQLSVLWMKIKSKSGKGGVPSTAPRTFPPRGPPMTFQRRPPMPPSHKLPLPRQKPTEVSDVLSRLKEIGK